MRKQLSLSTCAVLLSAISAFWAPVAHAVSPEDRVITYSFREDPQDPESDVVFKMLVKVTALDSDASTVGWLIENIEFEELDEYGDPVDTWGIDYPELNTPDGLWWVAHGDIETPLPQEFANPPTLDGAATAANPSNPGLDFLVQSGSCTGGCTSMFGGSVGALSFGFVVSGETEPVESGDDEPTEIEDTDDPA